MNLCERLIDQCISASCENPIFSGISPIGFIFNKSEIASFTYDQTNPNLITAITMKTHEESDGQGGTDDVAYVGYLIQQLGKQPFANSTTSMVENNIQNKFTENVSFIVADHSPAAANLLDNIASGRFVVVLNNDYTGQDGKGGFQVFGAKKGLVASSMERDPYGDNDGAWSVVLTHENAPNSALFIEHQDTSGDTPVVDTEAYLTGLCDDCE